MSTQEEIREGIHDIIGDCLIKIGCGEGGCPKAEILEEEAQESCILSLLQYLHSQGVAIRGDSLGSSHPHLANYYTFEPLIEVKDEKVAVRP